MNLLLEFIFSNILEKLLKIQNKILGVIRNLSTARRLTLVKWVITSQLPSNVPSLCITGSQRNIAFNWLEKEKFLWVGCAQITWGKCKINWICSTRPKSVEVWVSFIQPNLQGCYVCVCYGKNGPHWLGYGWCQNSLVRQKTSTSVGDGTKMSFWNDAWAQGLRPKDFAPLIFNVSRRKNISLSEALLNHTWIRDLNMFSADVTEQHLVEYCRLWSMSQRISLQSGICDSIS